MKEMGMETDELRGRLMGQHKRLGEAADAGKGQIAPQILEPQISSHTIAGAPAPAPPRSQNPQWFAGGELRQINDRGLYFIMDGMVLAVCWLAQGNDQDIETAPFKGEDFLGDKCLRQPRIALENECDF